jgi:hypothetical protein
LSVVSCPLQGTILMAREIISVTTEVEVYPSSREEKYKNGYLFSIPEPVLNSFGLSGNKHVRSGLNSCDGKNMYLVLKDLFGNIIGHRQVELLSGNEVRKEDFKHQFDARQLYPGQRIRLEVSLPASSDAS